MKRAREPLSSISGGKSQVPRQPSSLPGQDISNKRGRHPQQQRRSVDHASLPGAMSTRSASQEPDGELGPFQALLREAGIVWRRGRGAKMGGSTEGFQCRCNPAKLRVYVEKALMHDGVRREEFIEGLREFIAGPSKSLRRALLPLDCSEHWSHRPSPLSMGAGGGGEGGATRGSVNAIHESLIKVLLRVDCIQPEVINMLLEKLPEIVAEAEDEEGDGGTRDVAGAAGTGDGSFAQARLMCDWVVEKTEARSLAMKDLPRLVLNQVRFLDHLVDSGSLTKKLLECVTVLPPELQREMISYLPEVVEDGDHAEVVETLQSLRESEPSLLVAVLDALGNLSLAPPLLKDITADALGLLESAEPATLPVLLRFLLETATAETAEQVVAEVREKLRLSPVGSGGSGGRRGVESQEDTETETEAPWMVAMPAGGDESTSSADALTLEALRQGLRLRVDLAACFLKAIGKTEGSHGHSVVDLWVLFCLHANHDLSKKVMSLIRRKISLGHFTEAMIADALQGRAGALHGLFQTLLGVTDALLSSSAVATRSYGASIYRAMFLEFSELYHRQEIVGALLTHAGAGSEAEADSALGTLSALANAPDSGGGLRPFAAFIRGLLDYMEGFTHNQVRLVFRILCAMALPVRRNERPARSGTGEAEKGRQLPESSPSAPPGAELDDLHIFIRKHVAQSLMTLKSIGIIGAVAFLEFRGRVGDSWAGARECVDSQNSGAGMAGVESGCDAYDTGAGAGRACSEAQRTLTMLLSHCRSSQEGKAFLYDELALSAGSGALGNSSLEILIEMLTEPLEHEFMNVFGDEDDEEGADNGKSVLERGKEKEGGFSGELCGGAVKAKAFGDLDADIQQTTEVIILPLLASEDQQTRMKVSGLCPLFALLASCLRSPRSEMGMDDLSATLGASMIVADSHTVDNVALLEESHKEAVIGAHFTACNWIRELINAFVLEPDNETKSKLLVRVQHLCRLETDLIYMLKRCPGIRLPGQKTSGNGSISVTSISDKGGPTIQEGAGGIGGGAAPGGGDPRKGKGKGKAQANQKRAGKRTEGEMSEMMMDSVRNAMRPLSAEAVLVLGFPGMLIKSRDTQGETVSVQPVRVGLRGVHLMLQEMHGNLKQVLAPAKAINPALARLRDSASSSSSAGGNSSGACSRPPLPAQELLHMYQQGGVFRSLWIVLEMVSNSLCGVDESIGVVSSSVDDEDMLLPSLEIVLKILNLVCSSDETLGSAIGQSLLKHCLQDVFGSDSRAGSPGDAHGEEDVFESCLERLEDFASTMQQLPLAVQLVQVMEAVATARLRFLFAQSSSERRGSIIRRGVHARGGGNDQISPHHKVSSLCLTLLQKDWAGGDDKFMYKSSTIGTLVRMHLRWSRDPLEAVEVMASEVLPLLLETAESLGPAEGYPTLTAASFQHYFTPLLQALVVCWRDRTDFFARPRVPTDALLMRASRMMLIFKLLVSLTKGNPSLARRPVLVSTLRDGKKMLQVFLKSMSVFEEAFRANQQEIMDMFDAVQGATRHMQSLCAHGKEIGDASMSKEAPVVKKLLEEFIFRVRSLAKMNNCLKAIIVGNLINRNMDGEKLQTPEDEDSDSESNSEEESDGERDRRGGDGKRGEDDEDDDEDDDGDEEDSGNDPGARRKGSWSDTETESEGRRS